MIDAASIRVEYLLGNNELDKETRDKVEISEKHASNCVTATHVQTVQYNTLYGSPNQLR